MASFDPEGIKSTARQLRDLITEKAFEERARINQEGETGEPPENTYKEPTGAPGEDTIAENDRKGAVPPITPAEWKEVYDGYSWIPAAFEGRIGPRPGDLDVAIDRTTDAYKPFSTKGQDANVYDDINLLQSGADGFEGSSADAFNNYVVSRMEGLTERNRELIHALQAQYKSAQELFQESHDDLMELVTKARQSAEDLPGGGGDGDVNWGMASAIATIGAGVAAPSVSAVALFTTLAGLAAAEGAKGGEPPTSLGALSVKDLENRIKEGLRAYDTDRQRASSRMKQRLNRLIQGIDEYRNSGLTLNKPGDVRRLKPPNDSDYTDTFRPPGHDPG